MLGLPMSPLAGAGGCSASKTAFTSVNLVNLMGNHYLEFLDFRVLAHGCLRINCDKPRAEARGLVAFYLCSGHYIP